MGSNLRTIRRKSVFDFDSNDLNKAEHWAKKYRNNLAQQTKSPFFRAWFGDWRANEKTPIVTADTQGTTRNIPHTNIDTGWNINISSKVFNETKTHKAKSAQKAIPFLEYLDSIVKNAVLLNTEVIYPEKSENSLFMHNFYAVVDDNGNKGVIKLFVEEMYNPNKESNDNRTYMLQAIQNQQSGVKGSWLPISPITQIAGIKTIADLHSFVKLYDDSFKPSESSKVVDEGGKPLVVYHQTDADFTVFDTESKGAGRFDDETPNGIFLKPTSNDIGLQGKKQMALYANIKNPLSVNSRDDLVRFYSQNIDGYTEAKQKIKDIDEAYGQKFKEEEKRENLEYQKLWEAWRRGEISKEEYKKLASRDKLQEIMHEWENQTNAARESVKSLITGYFKSSAYDGIILEHDAGSFGRSVKTYIAFEKNQVKSATDNIGTYDKNNPDIRYSKDDTIYDYITDEYGNAGSAEDYEKIMEESPRAAVAVIYRNTVQMAQKALAVNGNIKLLEQDHKEIAQKALSSLGVDVYKNSEAADKLSRQIKKFAENVSDIEKGEYDERTKGNYFRLQFEGLCSDLSEYVKLSEQFVSRKRSSVRKDVLDFIGGNTLLLRDIDIPLIQQEYGTVQAFRSRMLGQTQVSYARKNAHGFYIEDFVDYINQKHPDIGYQWGMIDDGGAFSWLDDLVNNYLSPKLQRTANDNTRYYEDENSAGVAAAVKVISDLSQALHEKQSGSTALSEDVSALTQNAQALKNAKLKLARVQSRYRTLKNSFNKELSVREDTIKRDLRREYDDRLTKANTIKGIRRLINRFKSAVMNPTDERFIPPAARKNGVYEAFEALGNAAITRDGTKTAAALGKMLERIEALKNAKVEGEPDADYNDEFDADFTLAVTKLRQALEEKYPAGSEEEPSYKTISAKTLTVAEAKQI